MLSDEGKPGRARCPHCAARIPISREAQIGDRLLCPDCDEALEIVSLSPPRLYWALDAPSESMRVSSWDEDDRG